MTVSMLRDRGVHVTVDTLAGGGTQWRVEPGPIAAVTEVVEPDLPTAAPFIAAALVAGGRVRIPGWPVATVQAGDRMRALSAALGAAVTVDGDGLTVSAPGIAVRPYAGFDVDLSDASELVPVAAALAALATSPSRIRGVAHIRGHESDRLTALATELRGLGGAVSIETDGLTIEPRPLHAGVVSTHDDHRMVMFAAVLGLATPHVEVANLGAVTKTLPGFAALWRGMVASAEPAA
jgi:3-phosphoshikimate 1-carboxyvinyltransferase